MENEIEGTDGGIEALTPLHVLGDPGQQLIEGTIGHATAQEYREKVDEVWEKQKERRETEKKEGKPRKGRNHDSVIWNFFHSKDRIHYKSAARVFFDGNTLYSYGYHFRLAVRTKAGRYIINADKYSVTTSGHTSMCIGNSPAGTPQIPFSALDAARINVKGIEIVDKTEDIWEEVKRKNPKTGLMEEHSIHHLGACLFRHEEIYFLSSIDHGSRRQQYFLVQLHGRPYTVEEALKAISGLDDTDWKAYKEGKILRQGEYFFKPIGDTAELKRLSHISAGNRLRVLKQIDLAFVFPRITGRRDRSRNEHIATEYTDEAFGGLFARGTVRHVEHGMLKLGKIWHKISINNVADSWTALGGVD